MKRIIFALLMAAVSSPAFAQTKIQGRVLDPQEKPVAGIEVMLHALTDTMGQEVTRDTSAADGSFELGTRSLDNQAVYFVTVVYNGELYMGDMLRAPFPEGQEYIVRVGVNPVDFSGGNPGNVQVPPPVAEKDRTAGLMVIIVAALAIAAVAFLAFRRRAPAYRRWLVELARIEDDLASNPDDSVLLKRRAELRNRLLRD